MSISNLKSGAHIYLMGICGTAMASLAGLLKEKGFQVSGSDQNFYPPMSTQLEQLSVSVRVGYRPENLDPKPDLVIVGNVITKANPEAQRLIELKIPYMSLPQAMSEFLIADRQSVVIAGTHGKTTTTSLMAWTAEQAKLQPGFLVGGIPKNYGRSFQIPQGDWFVIEGDEYDTAFFDKVPKFIHYKPKYVVLTSIEFDHADIYEDLDHVKSAFKMLLELIPKNGLLVYNAEDANIKSLLNYCKAPMISYGRNYGDVLIQNVAAQRDGLSFTLSSKKNKHSYFLPMFGEYNAQNSAAVSIVAKELGWSVDLDKAFKSFQGVKRRQEVIGSPNDIQVIEDFAHHPTAVKMTVETFKHRPVKGKLHAVFEPRSATSRRKIFQQDYIQAFSAADFVYIAQPFNQTNLPQEDRFSSDELVEGINKKSQKALLCENVEEIIAKVKAQAEPGDTVVIMSNGGFDGIYGKMLAALS